MYGDRVGKFQFFQLLKRILCPSAILEFHLCSFRKFIDRSQNSGITIKNTNPFFDWNAISAPDLPLHLIIIADLHDFVALTQKPMHTFSFFFSCIRRIQISLQDLVQPLHSKKPLSHRSQHLDIKRLCLYISWKLLLDQRNHYPNDNVCIISFEKEEIPTLIIKKDLFSSVDLMCIHNDITL